MPSSPPTTTSISAFQLGLYASPHSTSSDNEDDDDDLDENDDDRDDEGANDYADRDDDDDDNVDGMLLLFHRLHSSVRLCGRHSIRGVE